MNGFGAGIAWGVMLALLASAVPTITRAETQHKFESGQWSGSALSDRHCQMNRRYPDGERLSVLISNRGVLSVVIAKDEIDFHEKDLTGLVRTDSLLLGRYRIEVLGVDSFRIVLGIDVDPFEALRRGRVLIVETGPHTFSFDLADSNNAILRLARCAASLSDKPKSRIGDRATPVTPEQDYVAFAAGQRSCAEFVAARQQPDDRQAINDRYAVEQWLAGYLTAVNKSLTDSENILGDIDLPQALTLLETLCLKDENAKLAHAAEVLVFVLYPGRTRNSGRAIRQ